MGGHSIIATRCIKTRGGGATVWATSKCGRPEATTRHATQESRPVVTDSSTIGSRHVRYPQDLEPPASAMLATAAVFRIFLKDGLLFACESGRSMRRTTGVRPIRAAEADRVRCLFQNAVSAAEVMPLRAPCRTLP